MENLYSNRIEGVDKIMNLELPAVPETPKLLKDFQVPDEPNDPKKIREKAQAKFNDDPVSRETGLIAVDKRKWKFTILFAGLLLFLLAVQVVWGNINASHKAEGNVTVLNQNTMNPSDVNVTVNTMTSNNYTIINNVNATLVIPDDLSRVLIKVLNTTGGNST